MIAFSVANGWGAVTMGFQAKDESTVNQWKRFASNTVSQSIVYNSRPNLPDTFSTAGQAGCVTGSGRPVVTASNQVLSARATDPDGAGEGGIGGTLRGDFSWQRFDAPTSTWVNVGRTVRLALSPGGSPADTDITGYSCLTTRGGPPYVWLAI